MKRVVIVGAGGRDFHTFNVVFREDPGVEVVAFTAAQIPNIDRRTYPPDLAGDRYPAGIPIVPQAELAELIRTHDVDEVVFAYSDIADTDVMHLAAQVLASGPDFRLIGQGAATLRSHKPVVAVCATRSGAGKSQTSRAIAHVLQAHGLRVALIRHPMPYGNLHDMRVQRFRTLDDIDASHPTIEEREEYELPVRQGVPVYAGVDYADVMALAEQDADVLLWDGGNNDLPFLRPDLMIAVADALRPGHELAFHPGEANVLLADVLVVNKIDSVPAHDRPAAVDAVVSGLRRLNPHAEIVLASSPVTLDEGPSVAGKPVLVIEDGPTVTHGGMPFGAASVAARDHGARPVDPRPFAVGSLRDVYETYPHLGSVLPAMGYSEQQIADLAATIAATPCEAVLSGTPIDLGSALRGHDLGGHLVRQVAYDLDTVTKDRLAEMLAPWITRWTIHEDPDA
ncbi:MAG: GTPase [Acidobacteriota bacterium]